MENIKIIFFDIDGTLVDPATGRISPMTFQTLHALQRNGKRICVATGRPPASLPDFGDVHFDALSTFNGSCCYTQSETIFSNPIPPHTVEKVIQNATALGRPVSIAVRHRLAANGWDQDLADYYTLAGLVLKPDEDFHEVCRQDIYQIMLGCREEDHPAIIQGAQGVKIAISWDRAVDVISDGGGKGSGIGKILEHFGLTPDQALAFGDGHNDIEMFEAVGKGIAMGNAADALKAVADEICDPVSQDGIYTYCRDHGLI